MVYMPAASDGDRTAIFFISFLTMAKLKLQQKHILGFSFHGFKSCSFQIMFISNHVHFKSCSKIAGTYQYSKRNSANSVELTLSSSILLLSP